MRKTARKILAELLVLTLMVSVFPVAALAGETAAQEEMTAQAAEAAAEETAVEAEEGTAQEAAEATTAKAKRTILLYDCGADLESKTGMASYNLRQVLNSRFSADDDIRFIVMTGGSLEWKLESEYLYDPVSGKELEKIDPTNNQIWEARGLDAADPNEAGKLVLLDADGVLGDGENAKRAIIDPADYEVDEYGYSWFDRSKKGNYEWMVDPEVLKAFINYGAEHFPAEKYDLILWDHGSGPAEGYGSDENYYSGDSHHMSSAEIMEALSDNEVTKNGGKFDFINFDACLMNCVELDLIISDYTDYYIASPETEPGYGQYYTGWLDLLGEDPETDTYELGQKIVDDYIAFYDSEEGDGANRNATLAVIDTKALMESGFVEALNDLITELNIETIYEGVIYDEFRARDNSINYAGLDFVDLGIWMSQLSYAYDELSLEDVTEDGKLDDRTFYTKTAETIMGILSDPDIIYAKGTKGIKTGEQFYRDTDGSIKHGEQRTSGIYITSMSSNTLYGARFYRISVNNIIAGMDPEDPRALFLNDYAKILAEYAAVIVTGQAVMGLASRGVDKSKIDYEAVKAYWLEEDKYGGSKWSNVVEEIFDLFGGEDADLDEVYSVKGWLSALIGQMAEEAVLKENVEVSTETTAEGTGYSITLSDIRKQVIDDIRVNLIAELPAVDKFLEDPENAQYAMRYMLTPEDLKIGSIKGTEIIDVDPETQGYRKTIEWLYEPISTWKVEQTEEKWYALKDTDGIVHVTAAIAEEDEIDIPLAYKTKEWTDDEDDENDEAGQQVKWNLVYLVYEPDSQGGWFPADLYFNIN